MIAAPIRVRAHAKINLTLRVGAPRADGFHPLQTVFQSLALHDTLEVTVAPRALRADVRRPRRAGRRSQSRLARRARAVGRPRPGGRAARRRRSTSRSTSRCRPGWAAAAPTRPRRWSALHAPLARARGVGGRPGGRSRRGWAPTCRTSCWAARRSAWPRRRSVSARGPAAVVTSCWPCPGSACPRRTPIGWFDDGPRGRPGPAAAPRPAHRRPGRAAGWRWSTIWRRPSSRRHPEIGRGRARARWRPVPRPPR